MFRSAMNHYDRALAAILSGSHAVSPKGAVYSFIETDDGSPVRLEWQYYPRDRTPFVKSRLPGSNRLITFQVHQLIAAQYLPRKKPDQVLRHLDDNRANVRLRNLIWGTRSDNLADYFRNIDRRLRALEAALQRPSSR